jgi:type I restriction enzyme S subunit
MNEWDMKSLGEVSKIKGRIGWKGYKTSDLTNSGPIVFSGTEIKSQSFIDFSKVKHLSSEKYEESPEIMLRDKDIMIATRGSLGQIGFYKKEYGPATINPSLVIVSEFQGIPEYLFYYFISSLGQENILSQSSGTTIPAIYQADLKKIKITFPPIIIQTAIAEILSSLDNKIELNNKINQELEALAQTLFKRWFVDFEFPNENGEPYKSSGGEMVDSELGEIPKGWKYGTLKDEFHLNMGQSPKGETYNETGDGMIFFQGRSDFGFRFPALRMYTNDPKKVAKKFETLISVRAPVGDINMAESTCCIGRGIGSISHEKKFFSYTYYKILSLQGELKSYDNEGTVFGSINKETLGNIKIIIPPVDIAKLFNDLVCQKDSLIYNFTQQNQNLINLRDKILPKLISGELEVS